MQNYLLKNEAILLFGPIIDKKIEANNVVVKEQILEDYFKIGDLIGTEEKC